ncbi:TraR/DksA C4-type zinc finger protein [Brooklawnia cerclae]|uniref:RNA polymerase-binding transcription factor DksA n=1 Tax=Brooklawnia cerclae TaxID=349934 RepID=A0ABX0SF51_9ACTN|nr:TraR/DksA family transcriptional regulator [Brooklawnia cerclae]NIH56635.1 RNA polymerase-binding transcription factor DksA [Brooklawnia cerclae]
MEGVPTRAGSAGVRLRSLRADAESARTAALTKLARIRSDRAGAVTDDEHDPEGPTLVYEWALAEAELAAADSSISQVDAALARITGGTYGICVDCGRLIAPARLDARPVAETCIDCARKRDRGLRS